MGILSYQSLLKSPIAKHSSDESGMTPASEFPSRTSDFVESRCVQTLTHVIGRSVAKYILKCFFLGDVLRCFSDDDS
jgi:hypothetical protein